MGRGERASPKRPKKRSTAPYPAGRIGTLPTSNSAPGFSNLPSAPPLENYGIPTLPPPPYTREAPDGSARFSPAFPTNVAIRVTEGRAAVHASRVPKSRSPNVEDSSHLHVTPPARFHLKTPPPGQPYRSRKENPTLSVKR